MKGLTRGGVGFEIPEVHVYFPVGFWSLRSGFSRNGVCCFSCLYEMLLNMRSTVFCDKWDGFKNSRFKRVDVMS